MDWDDFSETDLHARITLVSSSVVLTVADVEDLAELTERINDGILRDLEYPQTLRGLVRYVLGTDIPDEAAREAHVQTWLAIVDSRIDAEVDERREIRAELARREFGGPAAEGNPWAEFDTMELKLRVTREKLTTRFTPSDKNDLGKFIERIKHVRRRRAVEGDTVGAGPTIGDSIVIRVLIRVAAGRDLAAERRRSHIDQVVDRIVSAVELAVTERTEIEDELRRRRRTA